MIVSVMLMGAGSVDVSARPILPTTFSNAGSWAMMRSCSRKISVALVNEIAGSVIGMYMAVSSFKGGMNSEPMVVARHMAKLKRSDAPASVVMRCLSAHAKTGL